MWYHVGASPFRWWLKWFLVNSILPQAVEEMFCFIEEKTPQLCGFWRFANAYLRIIREKERLFTERNFAPSDYEDSTGRKLPMYLLDRDFTTYLIMGFTGTRADEWKLKYIQAFNDMESIIKQPLSMEQMMRVQLGMVDGLDTRVSHLENTMNIDYAQQKQLKNFANEIVVAALGGKNAPAYRYRDDDGSKISSQCFSRFWHDFNDYFNINAYANLPRVKFDEALQYINRWQPPTNMQLEIGRINREVA